MTTQEFDALPINAEMAIDTGKSVEYGTKRELLKKHTYYGMYQFLKKGKVSENDLGMFDEHYGFLGVTTPTDNAPVLTKQEKSFNLKFDGVPHKDVLMLMKGLGMSYNSKTKEWYAYANYDNLSDKMANLVKLVEGNPKFVTERTIRLTAGEDFVSTESGKYVFSPKISFEKADYVFKRIMSYAFYQKLSPRVYVSFVPDGKEIKPAKYKMSLTKANDQYTEQEIREFIIKKRAFVRTRKVKSDISDDADMEDNSEDEEEDIAPKTKKTSKPQTSDEDEDALLELEMAMMLQKQLEIKMKLLK